MHIAILTLDGFNPLDSLIAHSMLSRLDDASCHVSIASPDPVIASMTGLKLERQISLKELSTADAVLIGSGSKTRDHLVNKELIAQLRLDPSRQLIGAQCSGALILAQLGLLKDIPACTDLTTAPWLSELGVEVLDQAFSAKGNIATSGGCLGSLYLACWIAAKLKGIEEAKALLHYVAPVGEKEDYLAKMITNITPYL